jgi:anti-sigma regulatory factor (Ser/Thr protein kinase)
MDELSLHVLDIAQNSISAGSNRIEIEIKEDTKQDSLVIRIRDDGRGIPQEELARVLDPFVTSRTTRRVGLGLSLLQHAALQCGGDVKVTSVENHGTEVVATFVYSHVDRMPLGDVAKTMTVLIVGNPDVDFRYRHSVNGDEFCFDTQELREQLDGVPLNDHLVVGFIRDEFKDWMTRRKTKIAGGAL